MFTEERRSMRKRSTHLCLAILLVLGSMTAASAQTSIEKSKVPRDFLKRVTPKTAGSKEKFAAIGWRKKKAQEQNRGVVFETPGFDCLVTGDASPPAPVFLVPPAARSPTPDCAPPQPSLSPPFLCRYGNCIPNPHWHGRMVL